MNVQVLQYSCKFGELLTRYELNTARNIQGMVDFVSCDPSYNIRYLCTKLNAEHDVLALQEYSRMTEDVPKVL